MKYLEQLETFAPRTSQECADRDVILDFVRKNPEAVLTRGCKLAHMTASGFILNRSMDKVLLVRHNIYKTWAWTGGHADGCPDLETVVLKEAREETGLKSPVLLTKEILSLDILPVVAHWKNGIYVPAHLHFSAAYVLIADENQPLSIKPDENSGVAWFAPGDAVLASTEPWMRERIYMKLNAKMKLYGFI